MSAMTKLEEAAEEALGVLRAIMDQKAIGGSHITIGTQDALRAGAYEAIWMLRSALRKKKVRS